MTSIDLKSVAADVRAREGLRIGPVVLPSRYLVSPLAGYTNLAFRRLVRGLGGVGLATTDLVNARALIEKRPKTLKMVESHDDDRPFSVQIFGSEPWVMREAAQMLEGMGVDLIDINMGCPVEHVTKNGAGASMMCAPEQTVKLAQSVVDAVKIPVTVKMRLGWDATQITAPRFARDFEKVGVKSVMIHGRTREQGFRGTVDREGIRKVVEAVESIPVIANGDMRNVEDVARMFVETGCRGVSIGRGALANPWIFSQLVQWEETGSFESGKGFDEWMDVLVRQFEFLCEQHGDESGVIAFRKTIAWYLKAMRVYPSQRDLAQRAQNGREFYEVVEQIKTTGPMTGDRNRLPELNIPVPGGPNAHW